MRMGLPEASGRLRYLALGVLLIIGISAPGFGQEKPVLLLLPLDAISVSEADTGTVNRQLEASFSATEVYSVIPEARRDQELGETAECSNQRCARRIGRELSADQVMFGTFALAGGRYIINARIIDTSSGDTLAADSISTGAAEQLADICTTLARGMTRRAVPGSLAETSEEAGEAGLEDEQTADSGAAAAAEGVEPGVAGEVEIPSAGPTEQPPIQVGKPSKADRRPLITVCGGIALMELGNVSGSVNFELRDKKAKPAEATNLVNVGYYVTTGVSFASWAGAAASVPIYLHFFPEQAYVLSDRGTRFFAWGAALSVAGNFLDMLASEQRFTNDFLYADYLSAGTNFDMLYRRYRIGYIIYLVERVTSYACWALGGAGMIGAFFLEGPGGQPISSFWERTMLIGGMTLIGLGSMTRTLALTNRQIDIEEGGNERAHNRYVLYSVLTYGAWALGGAGVILPFVADIGRGRGGGQPEPLRPQQLYLLPVPRGMMFRYAY